MADPRMRHRRRRVLPAAAVLQAADLAVADDTAAAGEPAADGPVTSLLPVLPVRDLVVFPYTITALTVESPAAVRLVREAVDGKRLVALMPHTKADGEPTRREDFFGHGCVGRIVKMLRFPDDSIRILVRGVRRARLETIQRSEPYLMGVVTELSPPADASLESEALARNALSQFQEVITLSPNLPDDLRVALLNIEDLSRLADLMADSLSLKMGEKLELLALVDVRTRLERLTAFINREIVVLKTGSEIQNQVSSAFAKNQREHFLREQLKAVQEQLGQEAIPPELVDLREQVAKAQLPTEAREAATRELDRLRFMHPSAAEYNVARTYVDWLVSLPWSPAAASNLDLAEAARVLDRDHYDLAKIKERILEFLAVMRLRGDLKAPILCFVGPPGVGKTSLGQSIARALGRPFVRVSLGGVRDEAEIRGHRRTYVGALPGRIIQGVRRAKSASPVFMLDEIDKLGTDFRGDPASALLEVLDPEQNGAFSDHYLEVPFDLSRVLFITTANLTDPIPPALFDRMEVLRLPGYTLQEKKQIARRYLVPRQLVANGLDRSRLRVEMPAVDAIVRLYTSEAGVRNLEREIGAICRKFARRLVEGRARGRRPVRIAPADLKAYLGPQKLFPDMALRTAQVGVATGLAWTAAGGEILQVEVTALPGKGNLTLTGSLGEVMKESAQIAFSFVKSHHAQLGFAADAAANLDFHVHVPAGATPKDGPSAGVAVAAAMASLLSGRPFLPCRAVTGEISLRGRVLPVGGIKEKVLAAARSGVRLVVMPEKNRHDLEEVPEEVRKRVEFAFVEDASEALRLLLAERAVKTGVTQVPPSPPPGSVASGSPGV